MEITAPANFTEPTYFRGVYYLESQNPYMNPIAIVPEITPPDYVAWNDTSNGRILRFKKILLDGVELKGNLEKFVVGDKLPKIIEFVAKDGQIYKLVKLTLPLFNEKLIHRVAGGEGLKFKSDEELQEYYLKTDFYTAG